MGAARGNVADAIMNRLLPFCLSGLRRAGRIGAILLGVFGRWAGPQSLAQISLTIAAGAGALDRCAPWPETEAPQGIVQLPTARLAFGTRPLSGPLHRFPSLDEPL